MTTVTPVTVIVRSIGRPTLRDACRSVRAQQLRCELVVVDAAGVCGGPREPALRALLDGLDATIISTGQPLHRSDAAQRGLDAVTTPRALFLDDDDLLLPAHVRKLSQALDEAPEAVLAHTGVEVLGGADLDEPRGRFDQPFEPWELLLGNRLPIHAALFDVARVRAAGVAFDRSLDVYEDWDFWLQLAELGRFVHVGGISARYHLHEGQSNAQQTRHGDEPYWRVWRKWWSRASTAWWNEALRQREVAMGLRAELGSECARHEATTQLLQAARDEGHATQAALDEARRQRQSLQAELDTVRADRDQRLQQLEQTQQSLDLTRQALTAEREHVAGLELRAGADAQTMQLLRHAHAEADVEGRRVAEDFELLQASASWQLTRPLRVAEGKLRGARRRVGVWRRRLGWTPGSSAYRRWIETVEATQVAERRSLITPLLARGSPRFSVLMPVFNPHLPWLDEAIASLQAQTWPHWQLCIADDASTAPSVREHLRGWAAREPRIALVERGVNGHIAQATNDALALAQGDWVCFLDQDDRYAADALAEMALTLLSHPEAVLLYSDEDKLDAQGRRFEPHFKPSFSTERLRGQNFVNHALALPRARLLALGGLRPGFDGAQDHDLVLRATEGVPREHVTHVPRVLYHWRCAPQSTAQAEAAKPYALQAAWRAVTDSLQRMEPGARAEGLPNRYWLRVRYPLPAPRPALGPDGDACWISADGQAPPPRLALDELLSLLFRPGVGVVGATVRDGRGRFVDGARFRDAEGQEQLVTDAFGQRLMVQDADVLPAAGLLLRREVWLMWLQAGGDAGRAPDVPLPVFFDRVRAAGWRVLWTPFVAVRRAG